MCENNNNPLLSRLSKHKDKGKREEINRKQNYMCKCCHRQFIFRQAQ
jgi:hypothetical protein